MIKGETIIRWEPRIEQTQYGRSRIVYRRKITTSNDSDYASEVDLVESYKKRKMFYDRG